MQASETKLRQLIEGTKQYVVPLFQRPYSWSEKQWKTLWADILEQSKHTDGRPHFFGSIVATPAKSVPHGVGKYLLIDGQQRITTVLVLLAALRDTAAEMGEVKLQQRINDRYLTNSYEDGDERLKILPTQDDREAFHSIVWQTEIPDGRLGSCFQFFLNRLQHVGAGRLENIHLSIVDRLSLVDITCDEHDNPHLIFESLNAKGEKLTPADLIRNFLLMRVHVGDQSRLFTSYWLPIQKALGADLTEFVRHFLMKEGKILKDADVYFELKDRMADSNPPEAEAFLRDLHRHGVLYAKFVNPSNETDTETSAALERLRRLKLTVAYPFLLRVFDAFEANLMTHGQLLEILSLLESFLLRRSICGMPSNQLRRMLPPVFDAAGGAGRDFIPRLRKQLGGKRCPTDAIFSKSLANEPLYSTTDKNSRLRLILEGLERSFDHKESPELAGAQIEHIMPQTTTPEWVGEVAPASAEQALQVLHLLGNLTLTKYNAELSNRPYTVKRKELLASHYELNRYFAQVERWTPDVIRKRGSDLAQRALRMWPDVGRDTVLTENGQSVVVPVKVRFKETTQPVSNWKDAFIKLLSLFEETLPGLLDRIARTKSLEAVIAFDDQRFRRSKVKIDKVFVNTHASAAQLRDWCQKIAREGKIDDSDFEFIIKQTS